MTYAASERFVTACDLEWRLTQIASNQCLISYGQKANGGGRKLIKTFTGRRATTQLVLSRTFWSVRHSVLHPDNDHRVLVHFA